MILNPLSPQHGTVLFFQDLLAQLVGFILIGFQLAVKDLGQCGIGVLPTRA
jgi:hypothetical protein